jgi:hypothetical protein
VVAIVNVCMWDRKKQRSKGSKRSEAKDNITWE